MDYGRSTCKSPSLTPATVWSSREVTFNCKKKRADDQVSSKLSQLGLCTHVCSAGERLDIP